MSEFEKKYLADDSDLHQPRKTTLCPKCGSEMDRVPQFVGVGNPYPTYQLWKCYRCGHEEKVGGGKA